MFSEKNNPVLIKENPFKIVFGYIRRNKLILGLLTVFLLLFVGFHGYINPNQIRSFGDISPNIIFYHPEAKFQYFYLNFEENFTPLFNAPYRYQAEKIKFYLNRDFDVSKYQTDWLSLFAPLLVSAFLSYFFYFQTFNRHKFAIICWGFFTFSTFALFTSSIHTQIITSINLLLFYIYLTNLWIQNKKTFLSNLNYIFSSSLTAYVACVYEMRMLIIVLPFLGYLGAVTFLNTNKYSKFPVKFINFVACQIAIGLIVAINFLYIILNINVIAETVSSITGRTTWGNVYFQLINALAIYHPFWNGSQPDNFIYNAPSLIYLINILLFVFTIIFSFILRKKLKIWFYLVFILLFHLLLVKQNNGPVEHIYDFLYQYPYFSLSREASKYYYSFIIIWGVLMVKIIEVFPYGLKSTFLTPSFLFIKSKTTNFNFITKVLLFGCIILPLSINFSLIASGHYGNAMINYPFNNYVYKDINQAIENSLVKDNVPAENETRVLWMPYIGNLQDNTKNIKHSSLNAIINLYPGLNIQLESRNFKYKALRDENFKKYLKLLGFTKLIIPNVDNEPSIKNQTQINFSDFNLNEFTSYIEKSLPVKEIANVAGYKIYNIAWQNDYSDLNEIKIASSSFFNFYPSVNTIIPTNKTPITQTDEQFNSNPNPDGKIDVQPILNITDSIGNCNANPIKNLNFKPADRTTLSKKDNHGYLLKTEAFNEEIPCAVFQISNPSFETTFLDVSSFEGDTLEISVFSDKIVKPPLADEDFSEFDEAAIKVTPKSFKDKFIPIKCKSTSCKVYFYLRGKSGLIKSRINSEFRFVNITGDLINYSNSNVKVFEGVIYDLTNTPIKPDYFTNLVNQKTDYLLFKYPSSKGYVLKDKNNIKLAPIANNHSLLLFSIPQNFDTKSATLIFEPELIVTPSLKYTDYINGLTIFTCFIVWIAFLSRSLFWKDEALLLLQNNTKPQK